MADAPVPAQPASDRFPRIAGPIHTIAVLVVLIGWTFYGKIRAAHLQTAVNPNRIRAYGLTILFEWLVFAFVLAGVRHSGTPLRAVLGERWQSAGRFFRDVGIAAAFWVVSAGVLFVVGRLLHIAGGGKVDFILPHTHAEIALWIVLSLTAGICEETIFRGYLQPQFMALTGNAPAGILLSAAAFGAAHAYQGPRMMVMIAVFGAMFGILAHWRRSIRPGIIAHVLQDSLSGVLAGLLRH